MTRAGLIDLLWEKSEPLLFFSREEFVLSLSGWELVGHELNGELAWITCQKGPEFHFQSIGRTRLLPPKMIRGFLQSIIDTHGYAITKTPELDTRQHRFNRAYGFVPTGEDEHGFTIYRIERLPHE